MMPPSFSRLLSCGVWELTAEAGKRFVVHEDVLASQSQRLKDIIDAFTAAEPTPRREIPLDNWDADTVGRFVEYVYTGDYQSPDPVLPSTPTVTPNGSGQGESSNGQSPVDLASDPSSPEEAGEGGVLAPPIRPLTPLSECFSAGPDPQRKLSAAETFAAKYFDPSEHDFEDVFLAHAKIFALAQEFEMHALQTLAVQRLLRTFINIESFQSDWPVALNLVELARYSYSGNNPSGNDLRHIVSQFAALNFTALQTDQMKLLIGQSGWFARDLTEKVCRRLIVAEKVRDDERKERKELRLKLQSTETELEEERERLVGLKEKTEKLVDKTASSSRLQNPLFDRKPPKNTGPVAGSTPSFLLASPVPDSDVTFRNIPLPPSRGPIPKMDSFNSITGPPNPIFSTTTTTPLTTPSFSLVKEIPAGGSAVFPTSSQPGAKSIFESNTKSTQPNGLFSETGANKTPTKTKGSSSYGLFDTPPLLRNTSVFVPISQTPTICSSLDPVKQLTPSPSLFGSRPSSSTIPFGIEESGGIFGNISQQHSTPSFGSVKPTFGKKARASPDGGFFGQNPSGPSFADSLFGQKP